MLQFPHAESPSKGFHVQVPFELRVVLNGQLYAKKKSVHLLRVDFRIFFRNRYIRDIVRGFIQVGDRILFLFLCAVHCYIVSACLTW